MKYNTYLLIVTHNELRMRARKSFDEVWVQENTASLSWLIERDEKRPILVDSIFQKSAI